ncbi:hypothetical protein MTO96_004814 [Rhipicephalus appendiculatus]
MEATREWVGTVAGVVTLASFVGGLSLAWRVRRAATSTGIAFAPVAAAAVCCHSWLLYGRAAKEFTVVWVNACGLPLMLINAAVHRAYARDSGPGWLLLAALSALQLTAPMMSVVWLGRVASLYTVACNAAPVSRIKDGTAARARRLGAGGVRSLVGVRGSWRRRAAVRLQPARGPGGGG